jgi:hypothetical protein
MEMKRAFIVLACVLALATVLLSAAPTSDAQGFIREEVVVACGTFETCYTVRCQLGDVPTCQGFQICPCP